MMVEHYLRTNPHILPYLEALPRPYDQEEVINRLALDTIISTEDELTIITRSDRIIITCGSCVEVVYVHKPYLQLDLPLVNTPQTFRALRLIRQKGYNIDKAPHILSEEKGNDSS